MRIQFEFEKVFLNEENCIPVKYERVLNNDIRGSLKRWKTAKIKNFERRGRDISIRLEIINKKICNCK